MIAARSTARLLKPYRWDSEVNLAYTRVLKRVGEMDAMVTLTALVGGGHHEELALHLRAARSNGLSWDEIKEVLLQTAIYCGVPAANGAFRIAQQVRDEEEQ